MKVQTVLSFLALGSLTSGHLLPQKIDGEEHNIGRRQQACADKVNATAQNGPTMTPQQKCAPAAREALYACDQADKGCTDKVTQKTDDCHYRVNFVNSNATELQAWMKKDFDMIRQSPGFQSKIDANSTREVQMGTLLDAAEQDLIQNFGEYDFEARVKKHFKGLVDLLKIGYDQEDEKMGQKLGKAVFVAVQDILKMDLGGKVTLAQKDDLEEIFLDVGSKKAIPRPDATPAQEDDLEDIFVDVGHKKAIPRPDATPAQDDNLEDIFVDVGPKKAVACPDVGPR